MCSAREKASEAQAITLWNAPMRQQYRAKTATKTLKIDNIYTYKNIFMFRQVTC